MSELRQNYEKVSRIGSGAYGEVWKARDTLNPNMMVALKRIRSPSDDEGVSTSLLREVSLLIELNRHNNDHIVKLLDVCPGNHNIRGMELYLVFEHVEQDLATYLMNAPSNGLSLRQIKSIIYQLLDGISVIHENRIEHRDLKPQNVLITDSGLVKIADFGLARLYKPNSIQTSVVATLWYRSPEVLLATRDGYASAVDMWGAGCIFGELARREPLFQGTSENSQLVKIFEIIGSPLESEWPLSTSLAHASFAGYSKVSFNDLFPQLDADAIDLMERMLTFNPERRITAKGALAHPYFQSYTLVLEPTTRRCENTNIMSQNQDNSRIQNCDQNFKDHTSNNNVRIHNFSVDQQILVDSSNNANTLSRHDNSVLTNSDLNGPIAPTHHSSTMFQSVAPPTPYYDKIEPQRPLAQEPSSTLVTPRWTDDINCITGSQSSTSALDFYSQRHVD